MRARYYISFNGTDYLEFFPSNSPMINWTKEGDEIFKRPKVDNFKIARTKNETVFDELYNRFFDPIYFPTDIKYKINVLGTDKFFFIAPINKGKIDTEKRVYEVSPDVDDLYRDILRLYQIKYQDRIPDRLFGVYTTFYYPSLNANLFVNSTFDVFADVGRSIGWGNTAGVSEDAFCTLDAPIALANIQVTFIVTNFTGDPIDIWLVDNTYTPLGLPQTINANGSYTFLTLGGETYVRLNQAAISSGSFDYGLYVADGTFSSGGLLSDVLDAVINGASYMNLGLTIKSTILWNDALGSDPPPNIDTYITANPNNDYVIEGTQNWNYMFLCVATTFTTEKLTIYEYSLKDVLDLLKNKLRLWWFIDEDNCFRIEHEKYFRDYATQADLTSATYTPDKPEVDAKQYSYEMGALSPQVNYSENNQYNAEWIPYPVLFDYIPVDVPSRDINLNNLTTDFSYLFNNPDDADNAGLVLLRMSDMAGVPCVSLDLGTLNPTTTYLNGNLSWSYVLANYHKYFADSETGTLNNAAFTFTHVKEYLKQGNIKFRMANDLDWKKPFTLTEGLGWIDKAEYNPETGMYRIDVGLNPYSVTIYIVDSTDITTQIVSDGGEYLTR